MKAAYSYNNAINFVIHLIVELTKKSMYFLLQ